MKSLPKISIVIPSYNKVEYIQETLDSIVSQNHPNLEVIIQDGGSTDGTIEIIKQCAKKYPKIIKWVSKRDKGQVDAINKGLEKTTGEIVTYINADDVYEKGALNKVGKYFAEYPDTPWLAGKGRTIDSEGKEISRIVTLYKNALLIINRYSLLLIVNYLMQASVFLSKQTYKKHGPFTGTKKYVMEYDLWLKLGRTQMPGILKDHLASFRLTMGNISSTQFKRLLSQDLNIAKRHVGNPLILLLHYLHNLGRTAMILLIKMGSPRYE